MFVLSKELGDVAESFIDSTVERASLAISLTNGKAVFGDANSRRLKWPVQMSSRATSDDAVGREGYFRI